MVEIGSTSLLAEFVRMYYGDTKWPDWKNPNAYPKPSEATLDRWAFEFLLRNPEFVSGFQVAEKQLPPADDPTEHPLWQFLREWGMDIIGNESPFNFEPYPKVIHSCLLKGDERDWRIALARTDRCVMEFDLSLPIPPQIERAELLLKASQDGYQGTIQKLNKRPLEWANYLRLLDAEVAVATKEEMAETLYPGQENSYPNRSVTRKIEQALERAKELRDKQYSWIAAAKNSKG